MRGAKRRGIQGWEAGTSTDEPGFHFPDIATEHTIEQTICLFLKLPAPGLPHGL